MNDKKIITQKEKNYIETLYLYINLENVSIATDEEHSTLKYYNVLSYMADNMFINSVCLGESKGRTWYKFDNYRLGIMEYDKAKKAKQFNCIIQYEQEHLLTLDKNLSELDLPFDVDRKHYHIKRIDITKIAKHDEDYLTNFEFISPYRRNDRVNGTVYLGNRKNGNVFRMYNKTIELLTDTKEHPINYKKIALLSEYFGDIENLFTYELELHRKYLKNELGIETLSELSRVYDANKNIVSKIRFYENNDKNRKLVLTKKHSRIEALVLTDFVEYERLKKKRYKSSFPYAVRSMVKTMDSYIDSMSLPRTNDEYMKFINALISERIDTTKKDMVIDYVNTVYSDDMAQMTAKHKNMRENQDNTLEIESNRHFGSFVPD